MTKTGFLRISVGRATTDARVSRFRALACDKDMPTATASGPHFTASYTTINRTVCRPKEGAVCIVLTGTDHDQFGN